MSVKHEANSQAHVCLCAWCACVVCMCVRVDVFVCMCSAAVFVCAEDRVPGLYNTAGHKDETLCMCARLCICACVCACVYQYSVCCAGQCLQSSMELETQVRSYGCAWVCLLMLAFMPVRVCG